MPYYRVLATELITQELEFMVEADSEDEAADMVIDGEYIEMNIISQYNEDPVIIRSVRDVEDTTEIED
jgi:hypothetical protein